MYDVYMPFISCLESSIQSSFKACPLNSLAAKDKQKLPRAHVRLTQVVPLLKPLTFALTSLTLTLTLHPGLPPLAAPTRRSKLSGAPIVPSFTPFRLSTTFRPLHSTVPFPPPSQIKYRTPLLSFSGYELPSSRMRLPRTAVLLLPS